MNQNNSIHLELFKEVNGEREPSAYCFAFVSRKGIHFASFEHGKCDRGYMKEMVTRGNFIFEGGETQDRGAQKWRDRIDIYTNIPCVHDEIDGICAKGKRKFLEVEELDCVRRFIRSDKNPS